MKRYSAPWSKLLFAISCFLTLLCFGIGVAETLRGSGLRMWISWLPAALTFGCALFTIRGYTITPQSILVHRLLWSTQLPRAGLDSAQSLPHAMRSSIRTFGNGGFFSFSGWYWNKLLGRYRAYVTDPARTVVLHYSSSRTVLLSPAAPDSFVKALGFDISGTVQPG